jgi:hypothetical protein
VADVRLAAHLLEVQADPAVPPGDRAADQAQQQTVVDRRIDPGLGGERVRTIRTDVRFLDRGAGHVKA